jgi:hypothetical protein
MALGVPMALGLGDDDTKVTTASRRGSGKINSHLINLTLPVNPSIAFFRDEKHSEIEPDRHED